MGHLEFEKEAVLTGDSVEVDQSALTGESLPTTLKPGEAVFSGSIIRQGEIGTQAIATLIAVYGLFMIPPWLGMGRIRMGICTGMLPLV